VVTPCKLETTKLLPVRMSVQTLLMTGGGQIPQLGLGVAPVRECGVARAELFVTTKRSTTRRCDA
jgi:hypothetical protein